MSEPMLLNLCNPDNGTRMKHNAAAPVLQYSLKSNKLLEKEKKKDTGRTSMKLHHDCGVN